MVLVKKGFRYGFRWFSLWFWLRKVFVIVIVLVGFRYRYRFRYPAALKDSREVSTLRQVLRYLSENKYNANVEHLKQMFP